MDPVDSTDFKSMVGGLRYLVHTRPDISYAVGVVSRYGETHNVSYECCQTYFTLCQRYIKVRLTYAKGRENYLLSGFSDSDLAGNLDNRKSIGGLAFYLDESLITWV